MPERAARVTPVKVTYECDDCPDVVVQPTGMAFMSNPAKYEHRCPNCGRRYNLPRSYPYVDYLVEDAPQTLETLGEGPRRES